MAEERELTEEKTPPVPRKGSKSLIIIVVAAAVVLGAGGFFGYKLLASKDGDTVIHEKPDDTKTSIIGLDPFVLNLADHGRYLKVTIKFEVADSAHKGLVESKTPQLRDTIITLVSSKSLNAISSPEGKFQLKDEVLFRVNQVMGMENDIFRNLYFTEFVMQ